MKLVARAKNDAGLNSDAPSSGKLGTFAGVFTPSALTILGIYTVRVLAAQP